MCLVKILTGLLHNEFSPSFSKVKSKFKFRERGQGSRNQTAGYYGSYRMQKSLGRDLCHETHWIWYNSADLKAADITFPDTHLKITWLGYSFSVVPDFRQSLTLLYGEMKLAMHTRPASANSLATSAIRRMFSSRSSGLKPRFLFRPCLMLSPSRV